jgi:hypothetical protein
MKQGYPKPNCHPERRRALREAERASESKDPYPQAGRHPEAPRFHQRGEGSPVHAERHGAQSASGPRIITSARDASDDT